MVDVIGFSRDLQRSRQYAPDRFHLRDRNTTATDRSPRLAEVSGRYILGLPMTLRNGLRPASSLEILAGRVSQETSP